MKLNKIIRQALVVLPMVCLVASPVVAEAAQKGGKKLAAKKKPAAKKSAPKKKKKKGKASRGGRVPAPTLAAPVREVVPAKTPSLKSVQSLDGVLVPIGLVSLMGEQLSGLQSGELMVNLCCPTVAEAEDGSEEQEISLCHPVKIERVTSEGGSDTAVGVLAPEDIMCEFPEFSLVKGAESVGEPVTFTGRFSRSHFSLLASEQDGFRYAVGENRTTGVALSSKEPVSVGSEVCLFGIGAGIAPEEHEVHLNVGAVNAYALGESSQPADARVRLDLNESKPYQSELCFTYTQEMANGSSGAFATPVTVEVENYDETYKATLYLNLERKAESQGQAYDQGYDYNSSDYTSGW